MIKIKKETAISITINGGDLKILRKVCVIARIALNDSKQRLAHLEHVEMDGKVDRLIGKILKA